MKKSAICMTMLILLAFLCACAGVSQVNDSEKAGSSVEVSSSDGSGQESRIVSAHVGKDADPPLKEADFMVSDGTDSIQLDTLIVDFKSDKKKKELDNKYVGPIITVEHIYQYYIHEYDDFDLYESFTNYDLKNRDNEDQYIVQITLKTPAFKTFRGIAVGSSKEDVLKAYGSGEQFFESDHTSLSYTLNDLKISFYINEDKVVKWVILSVIAADQIDFE